MAKSTLNRPVNVEKAPIPKFDPTIDIGALDTEWLEQPKLYHKWAGKLAEARLREDEAKQRLELIKANLDKQIREDPDGFELLKITEASVAATILKQPEHKKAQKAVNQCRYITNMVQAAVSTLDHRRRALENLVMLHGRDYFSKPTVPEGEAENFKAAARRAAKQSMGINKKKNKRG